MERFLSKLSDFFNPTRFADWAGTLLPQLLVAAFIMFLAWLVWRGVRRGGQALVERSAIDTTAQAFMFNVARAVIFIVAAVMALGQLGINTTSVITSLGVAGLTIGFAAKDALSNVIAGIFIFWDRPFVLGDLVEIDGAYGKVSVITLRSTRVVTVDGKMLAIPNTTIVNSTVTSYTNFPNLRLDISATIGVEENIGRARELALGLIKGNDAFLTEPAPRFVVKTLNDYNIEVQLQAWLRDETTHVVERFALRERLFEAFREANVVMPYETIELAPVKMAS